MQPYKKAEGNALRCGKLCFFQFIDIGCPAVRFFVGFAVTQPLRGISIGYRFKFVSVFVKGCDAFALLYTVRTVGNVRADQSGFVIGKISIAVQRSVLIGFCPDQPVLFVSVQGIYTDESCRSFVTKIILFFRSDNKQIPIIGGNYYLPFFEKINHKH